MFAGIFRSLSFFMAANVRKPVSEGRSDCIPIFLSEIPLLFFKKIVEPDVSLITVSVLFDFLKYFGMFVCVHANIKVVLYYLFFNSFCYL